MRVRVCFLGGGGVDGFFVWVAWGWGVGVRCCSCFVHFGQAFGGQGMFFFCFRGLFFRGCFVGGGGFGGQGFLGFAAPACIVEFHPLRQRPEHISPQKRPKVLESELTPRGSDGKTHSLTDQI